MFNLWMVWRYLRTRRGFLNLGSLLSVLGVAIGVASMVVAMAVVSGYEATLRRSVIDVVGHVLLIKKGARLENLEDILKEIRPFTEGLESATPFVVVDAALAHNKKLNGVVLQGVDAATVDSVLRLRTRLVEGEFSFADHDGQPGALIGKGIRDKFNLKVGDTFRVLMPVSQGYDSENFRPKVQKFTVRGVLNIGRHDFDTRYIVVDIKAAQDFAGIGDRVTGLRLRLARDEDALVASRRINSDLGHPFWSRSWLDINHNLFQATHIEKAVIFFVLLVMVIAASFNVASTMFVRVLQRYSDIGILKTMGSRGPAIQRLFIFQGMAISLMGTLLGFALGLFACYAFLYAQENWGIISGEVYKLDRIDVEFRALDFLAVFLAAQVVCLIATLAPARRGARLTPTEGLRYE